MTEPTQKMLLITSYCGDEKKGCTDDRPCHDCLEDCNVFEIPESVIKVSKNSGSLDRLTPTNAHLKDKDRLKTIRKALK